MIGMTRPLINKLPKVFCFFFSKKKILAS